MIAPCGVISGCCRFATWLHSGSGLPALPTIRSTGVVMFLSLKMARSVPCIHVVRSLSARPRLTRTRFPLIGKHQLAAPPSQLTSSLFFNIVRQPVFLRTHVACFAGRARFCISQKKDRVGAMPQAFERSVVIKDGGAAGELDP